MLWAEYGFVHTTFNIPVNNANPSETNDLNNVQFNYPGMYPVSYKFIL